MLNKQNTELSALIQKYIAERTAINGGGATSMEQLNEWIGEFMEGYNRRELTEFEGYSPEAMQRIIYNLWDEGSPIKFKRLDDNDFKAIPILRQLIFLTDILQSEGKLKLTVTGSIPVRLLVDLYQQGVRSEFIDREIEQKGKIRNEGDCFSVGLIHFLAKEIKVVKVQKNIMTLTKNGEKLLKDKQSLLETLIKFFSTKLDLAVAGGYGSRDAGTFGNGFSLILLSKYGDKEQSYKFYAEKYYRAFPMLLEDFSDELNTSAEHWAAKCYKKRIIEMYFENFGFVEKQEIGRWSDPNRDTIIKKTSLFDKLFEIVKP